MEGSNHLVVFLLGEVRYAVHLAVVDIVFRAVEITPLPQAPEIVDGIINTQGRIVPIINMRRRFRLPEREVMLTDRIIIARTARRLVGLVVDTVTDVIEYPERAVVEAESITPGLEYVEGAVKLGAGLVLIHDLDRFLSLEEESSLAQAIEAT